MTEELKQKAKDFIDMINKESGGNWLDKYYLTDLLVMFATENGIQWHDLRKDPNDLPDTDRIVHIQTMSDTGKAYYDEGWHSSQIGGIIIAWCEEPQFKE